VNLFGFQHSIIKNCVNLAKYPLTLPGDSAWNDTIDGIRQDLAREGCAILSSFILPEALVRLEAESSAMAINAYYRTEMVNAYNIDINTALPRWHPGNLTMERGNAFVARDQIPSTAIIQQLYTNPLFQSFIADCFQLKRVHELADPFSGLVLNVIAPGKEHPWHFDTNEFTVSLLTQSPEAGGLFEYCPHIRTAQEEHFRDVNAVLRGSRSGRVRKINLFPGDLQLFMGRYSLHRVSRVEGATTRHSAIFAYSERRGVIGSPTRTLQLFGRLAPVHTARAVVRNDHLLD